MTTQQRTERLLKHFIALFEDRQQELRGTIGLVLEDLKEEAKEILNIIGEEKKWN
jgi:hypothetical protein